MRHFTIMRAGIVALLVAGAPFGTQAQSVIDKVEQKTDEAASKAKSTAREGKTEITDWLTAETEIALFADERVRISDRCRKG